MRICVRKYEEKDLEQMMKIWNEIVEEGIAFPQEELLTRESGKVFFESQTYTGVAEDTEDGKIYGLYILHPNNVGRCGHICNASYGVGKESRGKHIGEKLVRDCMEQGKAYGYKVLQFNAVVKTNAAARYLYEKLGFQQLGVIRGGFKMKDGHYEDICPYYIALTDEIREAEETGRLAFEVMQKLSFVRESCTPAEMEAAELICSEIRKAGVEPVIEEFMMDHAVIKKASLKFGGKEYEAGGYMLSGSTPEEGLRAPFHYAQDAEEADLVHAEGKIVLLNRRLTPEVYEKLIRAGVKGFITFTGTIIDDRSITDLPDCELYEWARKFGVIPGVNLRAEDALALVKENPEEVVLTLCEDEGQWPAHNVIAEVPGTGESDETIVLGGHYDSAQFSPGVYDNGAGSAILVELLKYFKEHPAKRNLKFVWFSAEERGLIGSKAFVKAHEEELKKIRFMINVDLAAPLLGADMACIMADESLCHMTDYLAKEVGFPITVKQSIYSSDSIPFTDAKIPSMNFFRVGIDGGVKIHHRNDDLNQVGFDNLARTTAFILLFCQRMLNSVVFPVPKEIPEKIANDIDVYLKRKKKEEV